jgi:uncharacterized protein (TIGR02145 family)
MKRSLLIFLATVASLAMANAQTPTQFNYQAVLRNSDGTTVNNQLVSVKVEILQGSSTGTVVFTETHSLTTSSLGLINLQIGSIENGLGAISWGSSSHYVRISVNDVVFGTSQLLSVPYAMHAKAAETVNNSCINGYFNELVELLKGNGLSFVDFSASTTNASPGLEIEFANSSPLSFTSLLWDFGDGITSTDPNPTHSYSNVGVYSVSLTATNGILNITETKNNYIYVDIYEVFDVEGNYYPVVKIGNQYWMAKNLKTLTYNDGESIPQMQYSSNTAGYMIYNNDNANRDLYGVLYNFAVVETDKICPVGWRVPSMDDICELINAVGGSNVAGGNLKSTASAPDPHPRWNSPNVGATDEFGFGAIPGGTVYRNGGVFEFSEMGWIGHYWTTTVYNPYNAYIMWLIYSSQSLSCENVSDKSSGRSIRCIKD